MITDRIREYYDELAGEYDQDRFGNSYGQFIDSLERPILKRLVQQTKGSILEVGCGTGRFLEFADVGTDISPKMLDVAKQKHPTKELIEASCDKIPLPDCSQEIIFSFHLLMHLNHSILTAWSNEMHRLLTDNGRWIVDVPTAFRRKFRQKGVGWHGNFAPDLSVFESLGWTIRSVHPILYLPIHRLPNRFRQTVLPVDRMLGKWAPKRLSSYQILELIPNRENR